METPIAAEALLGLLITISQRATGVPPPSSHPRVHLHCPRALHTKPCLSLPSLLSFSFSSLTLSFPLVINGSVPNPIQFRMRKIRPNVGDSTGREGKIKCIVLKRAVLLRCLGVDSHGAHRRFPSLPPFLGYLSDSGNDLRQIRQRQ